MYNQTSMMDGVCIFLFLFRIVQVGLSGTTGTAAPIHVVVDCKADPVGV